ncbi:MAG: hypothetical protein IBJ18_08105 [Phycisphaerales bacterium]|nr:hypothetical protein [Phycisphaerales bacterium]
MDRREASQTSRRVKITVLVPLSDELRRLRRALKAIVPDALRSGSINLIQIGPGANAAWDVIAESLQTKSESNADHLVILAGCAGSLSPAADKSADALIVHEIRDADGSTIACPWARAVDPTGAWRILSSPSILSTAHEKAAAANRFQTDIVDQESAPFARALTTRPNQPWLIIRGISDRHDETLPREVSAFVDHTGRTKMSAVLWSLARNPALIPTLMRLAQRTERAMQDIARAIAQIHRNFSETRELFVSAVPRHVSPISAISHSAKPDLPAEAFIRTPPTALPPSVVRALRNEINNAGGSTARPALLVMGGSFDPFTLAHGAIAHAGFLALESRSEHADTSPSKPLGVLFIPAARSPHKAEGPAASADDRRRMIELSLEGEERFARIPWGVWTDEIDRAREHPGAPSYSVHTAERLRSTLDSNGLTNVRLRWIVGADQALALHRWHQPARFIELADPIVLLRPDTQHASSNTDWQAAADRLLSALQQTHAWDEEAMRSWSKRICPGPLLTISSTRVRELLHTLARPDHEVNSRAKHLAHSELATLIHPAVAEYIQKRGVYAGL